MWLLDDADRSVVSGFRGSGGWFWPFLQD